MTVKAIPEGFHTITPYLAVKDAHGLVEFLKPAFDVRIEEHSLQDGSILNAQAQVGGPWS
jgi:PhnB protein